MVPHLTFGGGGYESLCGRVVCDVPALAAKAGPGCCSAGVFFGGARKRRGIEFLGGGMETTPASEFTRSAFAIEGGVHAEGKRPRAVSER